MPLQRRGQFPIAEPTLSLELYREPDVVVRRHQALAQSEQQQPAVEVLPEAREPVELLEVCVVELKYYSHLPIVGQE
jgi:hypothetical protein